MGKTHKALILLLIAAVLLIMLVLDLNLPAGVIHGIPYVVLISVSYWLPWRRAPVVLAPPPLTWFSSPGKKVSPSHSHLSIRLSVANTKLVPFRVCFIKKYYVTQEKDIAHHSCSGVYL